MSRRLGAIAAVLGGAVSLGVATYVLVVDFPDGIVVLGCILAALAAAWYGLLRRGARRIAAQLGVWIARGHPGASPAAEIPLAGLAFLGRARVRLCMVSAWPAVAVSSKTLLRQPISGPQIQVGAFLHSSPTRFQHRGKHFWLNDPSLSSRRWRGFAKAASPALEQPKNE